MPSTTKVIILANPPTGAILSDTFLVQNQDLPPLEDGQVLLKAIALNNLPAQRTWMDIYVPPILKGEVVRAPGLGEVVESRSDQLKVGQQVSAFMDWREYKVITPEEIMGVAPPGSGFLALTALGVNGLTAWAGAFREMDLKPEHTLVVSGAAGSVGSCLVQIAKHVVGCKRVVGIASKGKCDWVKSLGADECVDYKSASFAEDLKAALPEESDFFFDNVGGEVLDEVLKRVKRFGHITVCGAISGYHGKPLQLTNWREVIYNRYTIRGYIVTDYAKDFGQAVGELMQWVQEGEIKVDKETVVEAKFEDIPKVWGRLFTGETQGTLVTKLV
ncbi:uncharacterized protein MKK02DRAFT_39490 [Dioszegia hungarica]|uniref:Enoyl reductase (ER) domain-containing protein n=1 Tax=Dioszegia hungarica TaxID=4972 RepID=A0AA38HGM4_9TREE|nr:uncharacterized protein MKK02DRAFT_39490 [Dioszegia hungarica]KAI9639199.1 hypothetical protein MKK02DRAFT_39490 [Dioszegia hungarica]